MLINCFVLDVTYKIVDGKAEILLFCRTVDGKKICLTDKSFEPYFYCTSDILLKEYLLKNVVEKDKNKFFVTRIETELKLFFEKEKEFFKVFVNLPSAVPVIKDCAKNFFKNVEVFEYDIPFAERYLLDKSIVPMTLVEIECDEKFCIVSIKNDVSTTFVSPKILSIDIETYFSPEGKRLVPEQNPILMIALYGVGLKKVLTWKDFLTKSDEIIFLKSESEMISKMCEIIKEFEPDVIAGYFSDGFDFPYLKVRAEKNSLKLDFGHGSGLKVSGRSVSVAEINGIIHVDVFKFVRKVISRSMQTSVFTLDAVSEELLGEHKHEVDINKLPIAWDKEQQELEKFCSYNLHDSKLAHDLCVKILPVMIEFVKIIGLPLFDINRMSFSQLVEAYIMKKAKTANEIAPNKPSFIVKEARMSERIKGAFVFEPKPGLYKNIAVFDYRSLYPSIIASHNISPGTINCDCCKGKEVIKTDRGDFWFCDKKKGFLSSIIENLIMLRVNIKKQIKAGKKDAITIASSEALKVLANSFYGYIGFYNARWYSKECAEATTAFGRKYIHKVIDTARADGFTVLYSDSLPYDRMLIVKNQNQDVHATKIGDLYKQFKPGCETLTYTNDSVMFKKIVRVISHKFFGTLLRIITKYGSTIVTKSHSVYSYQEGVILVDAEKLKVGDYLISLTNPQLPTKYFDGYVFDLTTLDFNTFTSSLRLYRDALVFPTKIGECPYCAKNVELASHVNLQHQDRKQKFESTSEYSFIGSVNAKIGKIPRYWTLDYDLAWLLGFYCAEHSVSDFKTKTGNKALLSFESQNIDLIKKVKRILDKKIGMNKKIISDFDKRISKFVYYYRVQRTPIIPLFWHGFDAGKASEFKRVPFFILSGEKSLKQAFLKGYVDGDENQHVHARYKTKFVKFSTKSKELSIGLQLLLKCLPGCFNAFKKEIKHVAWKYQDDKPKTNTLRLQSAKESYKNFCLAQIIKIQEIPSEEYVYDVEVEDSHNFVDAEGLILVHNTDSAFLLLDKKTKNDAFSFVEKINEKLPGVMELDFEGLYPTGLFVSAKVGDVGAKKKYALIDEKGVLKIKGFETVRRNWSFIAKDVQRKVLEIVLKEQDPTKASAYLREVISDLRKNLIPLEKVVIHTQLQREVSSYKSVGPHVAAAQRMQNKGLEVKAGIMLKFVIVKGKGKIRDKVRLISEVSQQDYDADYYVEHQILPSVEKIFAVLGFSKNAFLSEQTQSDMNNFF